MQNAVPLNTGDGPDAPSDYVVLPRGKRKDYFTSALPFAQKGTAVSIPLGQNAPVKYDTFSGATTADNKFVNLQRGSDGSTIMRYGDTYGASTGAVPNITDNNIYADLSSATAATINQLREAFQIQRMYEKDARGGTRYTEMIRAHFGVVSPDARLQRPEYLGGGTIS